jgi:hypothetical protein
MDLKDFQRVADAAQRLHSINVEKRLAKARECFAYGGEGEAGGEGPAPCKILEPSEDGPCACLGCKFFKTNEQLRAEAKATAARLSRKGWGPRRGKWLVWAKPGAPGGGPGGQGG